MTLREAGLDLTGDENAEKLVKPAWLARLLKKHMQYFNNERLANKPWIRSVKLSQTGSNQFGAFRTGKHWSRESPEIALDHTA
jgi:hypothetical protein